MFRLKIQRRSQHLLYVEMILALLFFMISLAVILRVFAAADRRSRDSGMREKAGLCAQSIAEAYSVTGDPEKSLKLVFGEDIPITDGAELRLNSSLSPDSGGALMLTLSERREDTGAGVYSVLNISFADDETELCTLECAAYIPRGGAANE